MTSGAYLYVVRCADGSYYTGTARRGLDQRIAEHNSGTFKGYTATRRPVTLVFSYGLFKSPTRFLPSDKSKAGRARKKKR